MLGLNFEPLGTEPGGSMAVFPTANVLFCPTVAALVALARKSFNPALSPIGSSNRKKRFTFLLGIVMTSLWRRKTLGR